MTRPHHPTALQMIPIDQIVVLNPRDRNGRVFEEIVGNIKGSPQKTENKARKALTYPDV